MPKPKVPKGDATSVRICVWKASPENGAVGHTILETNEIYASFWPTQGVIGKGMSFWDQRRGVPGSFVPEYRIDKRREAGLADADETDERDEKVLAGTAPDEAIELFSLDVNAINAAFFKFRKANPHWSIFGSGLLGKQDRSNCSSLVAYLLAVGGIGKLFKPYAYYGRRYGGFLSGSVAGLSVGLAVRERSCPKGCAVLGTLIIALGGAMIGGAFGGAVDGAIAGWDSGKPLSIALDIKGSKKIIAVNSMASILGSMISAVGSMVAYDEFMHKLDIFPDHIAYIVKCAEAAESEQYEIVTPAQYNAAQVPADARESGGGGGGAGPDLLDADDSAAGMASPGLGQCIKPPSGTSLYAPCGGEGAGRAPGDNVDDGAGAAAGTVARAAVARHHEAGLFAHAGVEEKLLEEALQASRRTAEEEAETEAIMQAIQASAQEFGIPSDAGGGGPAAR